jgi:hypothetical protein
MAMMWGADAGVGAGTGRAVLVGVARNAKGEAVRTRLTTPEGYTLTARTSVDATMRVAAGEFKPGFQTPSMAFVSTARPTRSLHEWRKAAPLRESYRSPRPTARSGGKRNGHRG